MPNGYESFGELGRAFDAFRLENRREHDELSEDVKSLQKWLIASLGTVVIASLGSSFWTVFR